ncbi:MAG: DUF2948 family protein [Rhodobacteraceae bacterium]|nr:DUF2948 family protein [Paracoccaceae bacterium]
MTDASFQDGTENPVRLKVETADDLQVISTLVQDAVGQNSETSWMPRKHRFALMLNRFRWEDKENASTQNRPFERVQSTLIIDGVLKAGGDGIDPRDKDSIFSVLSIGFEASEDGAGDVVIVLAGDGAIRLSVECLDVTLNDVSRPYRARAKIAPTHDLS